MILPYATLNISGGKAMEKNKVICKTDAEILLKFEPLKDSGFVFEYIKKEDSVFQHYVNCNGRIFGPYEYVYLRRHYDGTAEWSCGKGDIDFKYENNGKDCKTEKRKRKEGNEVLSQKEIDLLLSALNEGGYEEPEQEYDRERHVLKFNPTHQEFFVTDKKKYGPYYSILHPIYKNEECFQFVYRKRKKTNNWYYNFNGKEIGPFQGVSSSCCYDEQNRAVIDQLSHHNFILIDGKKERCFKEAYYYCKIYETNNHKVIVGEAHDRKLHFKRDGIMPDFSVKNITILDNGDVAYSKIQDDLETWFYNDKQISIPVKGYNSDIYDSIITYKRKVSKNISDTPYFMKEGREYNGIPVNDYEEGFVYLDEGAIQFFPWSVPNSWNFDPSIRSKKLDEYSRYRDGMFMRLYYTNKLAGRD